MAYRSPKTVPELRSLMMEPPIDIFDAANALGLAVFKSPMENNISGKLVQNHLIDASAGVAGGTSGWSIIVNSAHPYVRQRFTIAHEIGHFIKHRGEEDMVDGEVVDDQFYRSNMSDEREVEANKFAANLLMPLDVVMRSYMTGKSINEMDSLFEVSREAMEIRLGKLPGS